MKGSILHYYWLWNILLPPNKVSLFYSFKYSLVTILHLCTSKQPYSICGSHFGNRLGFYSSQKYRLLYPGVIYIRHHQFVEI